MGTKNKPAPNDCYAAAEPDEPMFILLARDMLAPGLVLDWAQQREVMIQRGLKPQSDRSKVREARMVAADMMHWRKEHRE